MLSVKYDPRDDKAITRIGDDAGHRTFLWVPAYPREREDDVEGIDWVRGHVRQDDPAFKAAMAARALRSP